MSGFAEEALAQALPPGGVPQSVQPGRVLQQFAPPTGPAGPSGEFEVPAANPEKPPAGAGQLSFNLKAIVIDGSTVYKPGAFKTIYARDLNQKVSLQRVYDIANAITEKYRADGYILSQAAVPAQHIHDGVVHIQVVEGFVDQVHLQGVQSPRLQAYAEKIRQTRPLTAKVLERFLLLANDLAGMTVQSVFAASPKVPGAADLTLVASRKTLAGNVEMDNFGSAYQGPWQSTVSGSMAGVLGWDEMIAVRGATTSTPSQMGMFGFNVAVPIDDNGTSIVTDFSRTRGHPGYTLTPFDARTLGYSATLALQHYLIRSRAENLLGAVTFSYLNSTTRLNVPGSSDDHIRALRASLAYNKTDSHGGQNAINAEFSEGIPIANASRQDNPLASRPEGRVDFTKMTLSGSRLQDLGGNFGLLAAFTAQSAFGERLLSPEQFGVGGPAFGRGYDPSEITGDNGYAFKVELQKNLPFVLRGQDRIAQFFTYYDFGAVMSSTVGGAAPGSQTLASAGGGVRLNLGNGIQSMFEVAKPLTRVVASELADEVDPKDWRLYFSLSAGF